MLEEKQQISLKLMTSLGIINQLTDAWLSKALIPHGINQSQFNLLVHFSHHPEREQTISQLAEVMQMNQPGITKVVNKLVDMGLVGIRKDSHDGRKKWISINQNGLDKSQSAFMSFLPMVDRCFEGWDAKQLNEMLAYSQRLQTWLDDNRDS
ncbi:MarR family winged helix-turn-helix transcriptional regulator [Vibrio tapetis subsp. quintayensis]|uniref:MarR family winged helix-turn-helix transcriptional regulator n=1 Tax=Vibrio tapetis TaxID=52443 RepID=UPI0025B4E5C2|nr:MarR family winged helix-turn-helix transcriptional regulator [Vibrio tapetis]MDN3680861.1 MarR family winged helix-turn-helix transcriptional regulator [Vibrio tapetis subsp. quintayensis]